MILIEKYVLDRSWDRIVFRFRGPSTISTQGHLHLHGLPLPRPPSSGRGPDGPGDPRGPMGAKYIRNDRQIYDVDRKLYFYYENMILLFQPCPTHCSAISYPTGQAPSSGTASHTGCSSYLCLVQAGCLVWRNQFLFTLYSIQSRV